MKAGGTILYPQRLRKGDTVGVIAPASPPNRRDLSKGLPFLESLGLNVKLGSHIDATYGYLAGTDSQRLSDFHEMMADPTVQGILFARGGYGTPRLVEHIDYEYIKTHPKIIWGYSDITYLHTAIRQRTGLVTFHGSMVASDMAQAEFDEQSKQWFAQLFEPMTLHYTEDFSRLTTLVEGKASGQIVGGNLSLMVSSLGTPFEIDMKDKLVLIEDVDEVPYKVDSMLNQLNLAGKLTDVAGIIIGDFKGAQSSQPSLSLNEVFHHYFSQRDYPVLSGFKIGHCLPHFSVPLGVNGVLDTVNKKMTLEPGVT